MWCRGCAQCAVQGARARTIAKAPACVTAARDVGDPQEPARPGPASSAPASRRSRSTNHTLYLYLYLYLYRRRICSKSRCARSFRSKAATAANCWPGGLSWASHSRIPAFVTLARSIRRYRKFIYNTLDHGGCRTPPRATNTHLRALTKRAYGFHSPGRNS